MSKDAACCFEDQDIGEAAHLMEKKQIHRLPVLNRQKQMVGMLSLGGIGPHASPEPTGEVVEAISQHWHAVRRRQFCVYGACDGR